MIFMCSLPILGTFWVTWVSAAIHWEIPMLDLRHDYHEKSNVHTLSAFIEPQKCMIATLSFYMDLETID